MPYRRIEAQFHHVAHEGLSRSLSMQIPLKIAFEGGLESSDALRARIER